jgi:hypothetical protein
MAGYGISVPDRQLACAPVRSPEGQGYLAAMAAAANYGRANRQLLSDVTRQVFESAIGSHSTSSTTCPTTSPRSRPTTSTGIGAPCACTAKVQPGRCRQVMPTYPPTSRQSVSRS